MTGDAFKITLPNVNHAGERKAAAAVYFEGPIRDERQKVLLGLAEKQGSFIRRDVEADLKVSQATAILILRDMLKKGLLVKEGTGTKQRYRIAK